MSIYGIANVGISIHALREESDSANSIQLCSMLISIHALREESDLRSSGSSSSGKPFQSTLSVRRATKMRAHTRAAALISIHALREESDRAARTATCATGYFNPRSP